MSNLRKGDIVAVHGEFDELKGRCTYMLAVVMEKFDGHGALEVNSPTYGRLFVSDINDDVFVVLARGADLEKDPKEEIMRLLDEDLARLTFAAMNKEPAS